MKKHLKTILAVALTAGLSISTGANAAAILSQTEGGSLDQWDIGTGSSMSSFNALFSGTHTNTQTARFDNLSQMNAFDALWLNNEVYGTGGLTAAEISSITTFIGSGKKAVAITDNNNWASWNNSLENLLGATINDGCFGSNGAPLTANSLTQGVSSLLGNSCNSQIVSTPNSEILFSNNMAALYTIGQGEVLLITSVDIIGNSLFSQNNQFAQNVVNWLDQPINVERVDSPATLVLLSLGLAVIGFTRKNKKK